MLKYVPMTVIVVGCGLPPPAPGVACGDAGPVCVSATSALVCEGGKWAAYDCPGPMGCADNHVETYDASIVTPKPTFNTGFLCDWRPLGRGAACPDVNTRTLCGLDGGAFMRCDDGVVSEMTCARCDWFGSNRVACF